MGYTLKLSYVTLIVRGFTEYHGTKIVIFNSLLSDKKRNKPIFNTNTTSYINFAKRGLSFCVV